MRDEIDNDQLYHTAWKHWGSDLQMDILIEEMAELTQAIIKTRRNGVVFSYSIVEELADVLVCIDQLKYQLRVMPFGQSSLDPVRTLWDQVLKLKEEKLDRLEQRLMQSMAEKYEGVAEPLDTEH